MGSIFRQPGRSIWMIKYYKDGRPIYESSGTDIKDDARSLLRSREGKIADGAHVLPKAGRVRFEAAMKDVVHDYTANQRKSIGHVKGRIDNHLTPAFAGKRMSTITTADVRAYIAARLEAEAQPASINRELAILKRAFTLAIRAGTLLSKPHIPMLDEHNIRTGFFEPEQFEAVRKHLPDALKPVTTFAFLTGWRVRSEILTLTWAQVDEQAQTVRLDPEMTKNGDGRTFPYGVLPALVTVITDQRKRRDALRRKGIISPWLFQRDDGSQIGKRWFYDEWETACTAAATPGKIPHDFRRTAVRNLVRAGVSERVAMMLSGHKTRSVFDRYDIVNENDLRTAVSKLAELPITRSRKRGQR